MVCGSQEHLQNGHVFSRTSYSTRWDILEEGNCHTQCRSCNLRHERDFYPYSKWYIEEFGQEKLDELHFRYKNTNKVSTLDLENLYLELKLFHENQ